MVYAEYCDGETVCIRFDENEDGVDLYLNNKNEFPIKAMLEFDTTNLLVSEKIPFTRNVLASSEMLAFNIRPKNSNKKWKISPRIRWRKIIEQYKTCTEAYLCMYVDMSDRHFSFSIENLVVAPLVVKVEDQGFLNLKTDTSFPHVVSCPGKTRCPMFTATLLDDWDGWYYPVEFQIKKGKLNVKHDDEYAYSLPYTPGSRYRVEQDKNGVFSHQDSQAIDWAMPEGTPVHAARAGQVIDVTEKFLIGGASEALKDKGNNIKILHSDGSIGAYVHLMHEGAVVKVGDEVSAAQLIGYSGNTGYSTGPHLHFEVYGIDKHLNEVPVPIRFKVGKSRIAELKTGDRFRAQ